MTLVKAPCVLAALILYSFFAYGQPAGVDTLARSNAIYITKQAYQSAIAGNSQVFNGIDYIDPLQKKKLNGTPYFLNDEWHYSAQAYQHPLADRMRKMSRELELLKRTVLSQGSLFTLRLLILIYKDSRINFVKTHR